MELYTEDDIYDMETYNIVEEINYWYEKAQTLEQQLVQMREAYRQLHNTTQAAQEDY